MGEHLDSSVRQRLKNGNICVIHKNRVYDVTDFADRHPGGKQILKDYSGGDVTFLMQSSIQHIHSKAAYSMLGQYDVGPVSNPVTKVSDVDYTYNNNKPILEDNLVDWSKPILCQIPELREKYYEWVHHPVDRQFRMFNSGFMEFFSKSKWWYIPLFWIPITCKMLSNSYSSLSSEPTSWPRFYPLIEFNHYHVPFLVFCGIILWTLLEYGLHRWLFHRKPPSDSALLTTLHFLLHGQHHKFPMDKGRLVFPIVPAVIMGLFIFSIYTLIFPAVVSLSLMGGCLCGYIYYDLMHYYLHHGTPSIQYFKNLKKYHIKHHYVDQEHGNFETCAGICNSDMFFCTSAIISIGVRGIGNSVLDYKKRWNPHTRNAPTVCFCSLL